MNNFQRKNAVSNAHAGREFEAFVRNHFETQGLDLVANFPIEIGVGNIKKKHNWDFGNHKQRVIVECKSHTWTDGNKVPSAKLTTWDQAMYYMLLAPQHYRKIFACLRHERETNSETLAEYYVRLHSHLIPSEVEIWEFCEKSKTGGRIK